MQFQAATLGGWQYATLCSRDMSNARSRSSHVSFLNTSSASATSHMMALGITGVSCESLKFVHGSSSPVQVALGVMLVRDMLPDRGQSMAIYVFTQH